MPPRARHPHRKESAPRVPHHAARMADRKPAQPRPLISPCKPSLRPFPAGAFSCADPSSYRPPTIAHIRRQQRHPAHGRIIRCHPCRAALPTCCRVPLRPPPHVSMWRNLSPSRNQRSGPASGSWQSLVRKLFSRYLRADGKIQRPFAQNTVFYK